MQVIDLYNNVIRIFQIADFVIQMVSSAWNVIIVKEKISSSSTMNVERHAQSAIGLIDSTMLIAINVQTLKFSTKQMIHNVWIKFAELIRKFLQMGSVRTVHHIGC